ncbi:MAG: shikimate kinase [Propionibacteriaceae bacterium]|nr:shikimate kinase [Propionibacteriaceae bacterium]
MKTVALIGAPGAGKSTVGRALAARLGVGFSDSDQVIEERAGKPIAEIFADDGEPAFRALEERVGLELLKQPGVVSLGGGAVLNEKIRHALAGCVVVWLEVSIAQATRRVGMNRARPLLLGNVRARLIELLRQRTPLYREAATVRIGTDGLTPAQVVDAIEEALE